MYIELDHDLVAGKVENINEKTALEGREVKREGGPFGATSNLLKKYNISKQPVKDVLLKKGSSTEETLPPGKTFRKSWRNSETDSEGSDTDSEASDTHTSKDDVEKQEKKEEEFVIGSDGEVFFDHDFGFFGAILACYNNHWVLNTSPDDWWNVIVRNVSQAVDDNGEKNKVRDLFVSHEGKKEIFIDVGPTLAGIDYSWLFSQFSSGIKANIKNPAYADIVQADFSTSSPDQVISCQVMLMASLQKYFDYSFGTCCGIPGVEMTGSEEDWIQLTEKTKKLETLLMPIMDEIGLGNWFAGTHCTLAKLLDTYRSNPDVEWWSHVLSWNETYGSGARSWWTGWMIDFLMAGSAEKPKDFQSGMMSVPVTIRDDAHDGAFDVGRIVAGTAGFTVKDKGSQGDGRPVVEARQAWGLIMPKRSLITPGLLGKP